MIEIPIVGHQERLGYGVWTSLAPENFERFLAVDGCDVGEGDGPWFGWLSVRVPGYPDTLSLKTMVHLRPAPERPVVELEPTDHPLAVEQRLGIRPGRAFQIAERALHPNADHDEHPSDFPYVRCGQHGHGHGCFVCQHVANGTASGFVVAEDDDDPWPNAWCEQCETARRAAGGWTEDSERSAQVTIICHWCYEQRRAEALARADG